jgi:alanine dehydrogenase
MKIGVPREIKPYENRVALTPAGARGLVRDGHTVLVERNAGLGSGFDDDDYAAAGATLVPAAADAWSGADLIAKVKEPLPEEFAFLRPGLTLFTYLHLAAARDLTRALMDRGVAAIAYETVQLADGSLPLLTPMSEVAGRLSIQIGAHFLEKAHGGRGILLGGVPGVQPANVVVLGGGVVGSNAAKMALGLGASVTLFDISAERLRSLDDTLHGRFQTRMANEYSIAAAVERADLLIGAVLIPGARAPHPVTRDMVARMDPGAVVVDVSIDQGGCIESVDRLTTHAEPVYAWGGVIHYAVPNMPAAVPRTSTYALTNVTFPYLARLAGRGWRAALREDPALAKGANVVDGRIVHPAVAQAHDVQTCRLQDVL